MSTYLNLRRFSEVESDYLQVERNRAGDKSKGKLFSVSRFIVEGRYKLTLFTGKCSQLSLAVSLLISILSLNSLPGGNLIPGEFKVISFHLFYYLCIMIKYWHLSSRPQLGNVLLGLPYVELKIINFPDWPHGPWAILLLTLCGKYPDIRNNKLVRISDEQKSLAFHNKQVNITCSSLYLFQQTFHILC